MLLLIAKVFSVVFAALIISKSVLSVMQRRESVIMALFWILTWGAIVVLAFWPKLLNTIAGETGVGIGTLAGISLIFIYFVVYRVYVKTDRVEKDLQKLIREIAIKEIDEK